MTPDEELAALFSTTMEAMTKLASEQSDLFARLASRPDLDDETFTLLVLFQKQAEMTACQNQLVSRLGLHVLGRTP